MFSDIYIIVCSLRIRSIMFSLFLLILFPILYYFLKPPTIGSIPTASPHLPRRNAISLVKILSDSSVPNERDTGTSYEPWNYEGKMISVYWDIIFGEGTHPGYDMEIVSGVKTASGLIMWTLRLPGRKRT